jgi:hypothetical protein
VTRGRGPTSACDAAYVRKSGFDDLDGNVHGANVHCVAWYGITRGKSANRFDPNGLVTREQMASFLARLLAESDVALPANPRDRFEDDDGSVHEGSINALAELGLVQGKGDRNGNGRDEFDPASPVQRDQAASLVARLHRRVTGSLPDNPRDRFEDDERSVHESNINAMAELGVVQGKGDRNRNGRDEYDPVGHLTRAQAASVIVRDLRLLVVAEKAEPGGAVVFLDGVSVKAGEQLSGLVRTHKTVEALTANGCGLSDQAVTVGADRRFSLTVPASAPPGQCGLTLTVTTRRGAAADSAQQVPWSFDVTVTA